MKPEDAQVEERSQSDPEQGHQEGGPQLQAGADRQDPSGHRQVRPALRLHRRQHEEPEAQGPQGTLQRVVQVLPRQKQSHVRRIR